MKHCPFDSEILTVERDQSFKVYYKCYRCGKVFSEDLKRWGTEIHRGYPSLINETPQEMIDGDAWFHRQGGDHPIGDGDSGAPIVNEENRLVGFQFAGSESVTLMSDYENMVKELDSFLLEGAIKFVEKHGEELSKKLGAEIFEETDSIWYGNLIDEAIKQLKIDK